MSLVNNYTCEYIIVSEYFTLIIDELKTFSDFQHFKLECQLVIGYIT